MNALDTRTQRHHFSGVWGNAFESYCLDEFENIFRSKKWSFFRNPLDESNNNEEIWDGFALRDDTAIVIECKGTFVRSQDKYSGESGPFFRGLSRKFGNVKHGGIYQLLRGISRVWDEKTARNSAITWGSVTDVFPLMVVQDPIVGCGPVTRVLSDRFQTATQRRQLKEVWPLTVVTADSLDRLSSIVEATGVRLDSILKAYHRAHPSRMISLDDFLSSKRGKEFDSPAAREQLKKRFNDLGEATIQRFRDAAAPLGQSASDSAEESREVSSADS